jgi:valacyclovir hydrolase
MPSLALNGINLHWIEQGEGQPMLLLGGTLSLGVEDFGPQVEYFSRSFRIILPDRRGYGKSRPPDRDYPSNFYERDADDMAALLSGSNARKAIVLGWSEGADVAICLARAHPDLVDKLVVWGGIAAVRDSDLEIFESRRDVAAWPAKVQKKMATKHGDPYWKIVWWKWCDVMRHLHAEEGDAQLGDIENIACSTLILHGQKDPLISSFHPHRLKSRIRNSRLHEFEESGHSPHLQAAANFNATVASFIKAPWM